MSCYELAAEVKELRAKLSEMQRANEILKAASAFSQQNSPVPAHDDPLYR
nr:hypothetical protein [Actinomyces vulturis]